MQPDRKNFKRFSAVRLSGRLYFFPALLAVGEILPWLLGAVGILAGAVGSSRRIKRRTAFLVLGGILVAGAGVIIFMARPDKAVREDGTRLVAASALPRPAALGGTAEAPLTGAGAFRLAWKRHIKPQVLSSPLIADNLLVFGTYEGTVEAVSLKDGAGVWSLPQSAPVFALHKAEDGVLYASEGLHDTASSHLTAINARDGSVRWQREFLGHLEEEPRTDGERIWTGAGPGGLWALRREDGAVLWHRALGHIDSTPLLHDGKIYVHAQPEENDPRNVFYVLNAKDGETESSLPLPGQAWGSPLTDRTGQIILTTTGSGQIGVTRATDGGTAFGISPDGGKIIWQARLPDMTLMPDIYIPKWNMMICTTKAGMLTALDAGTGTILWAARAGMEIQAPATLFEAGGVDFLAAVSYEGLLTIRRAEDGAEVARYDLKETTTSSPAAGQGMVYVTMAHTLAAFAGLPDLAKPAGGK